jgi:hydrogenase maturation protein HypF
VDTRPVIRAAARDAEQNLTAGCVGRRFHCGIVEMVAQVCGNIRAKHGIKKIVLSGGVFMNAFLAIESSRRLEQNGFSVYSHAKLPANDGGLCVGQLMVAAS